MKVTYSIGGDGCAARGTGTNVVGNPGRAVSPKPPRTPRGGVPTVEGAGTCAANKRGSNGNTQRSTPLPTPPARSPPPSPTTPGATLVSYKPTSTIKNKLFSRKGAKAAKSFRLGVFASWREICWLRCRVRPRTSRRSSLPGNGNHRGHKAHKEISPSVPV